MLPIVNFSWLSLTNKLAADSEHFVAQTQEMRSSLYLQEQYYARGGWVIAVINHFLTLFGPYIA